ncbi:radical SAM/SPASM domain-containing protein [Bergeyella zoohelcum]|uniref:Anaerobic sulfatase-maturating enzyme homolog YdeM n=1 Tax=Bergeyella zoohelcum TaxID=1015 RepID=A0A7Z9CG61_9FLAO|nr:radical SAM protein [Bergeyella zoohelcum]VDH03006.1 Anaerobic sulfatase-maturating enzyme homolog YdeM [Bergeyella zoohelcum]
MKYSQFNTMLPYDGGYALYNSFENKVIFLEYELKEILHAAVQEGIESLATVHPEFYAYLVQENFLVENDVDEIQKVKDISIKVDNNHRMFFLTINPTMNCNFKCWYCYETHIKDSKFEVSDSIKKFISHQTSQPEMETFTLSFFGGEPLLYFKKDVVPILDHAVEECTKNNISLHISFTTNGYLIDEYFIEYFVKKNLHIGLQITFDGYGEEHDKVRFVNQKKGSYKEIVRNIKKLLEYSHFFVRARINYTNENLQNCHKIIEDFNTVPREIRENNLLFDFHRVWQNDQLDNLSEVLKDNESRMREQGFKTSATYSPNNVQDSCYADKRNSVTVNYNGDLYKCTARDFLPENRVGFLSEEGELIWENNSLERRMQSKFNNAPCLKCKILPLCNGGCSQHAIEHLEIGDEYCVYHGDENEKDKVILTKIEEIVDAH